MKKNFKPEVIAHAVSINILVIATLVMGHHLLDYFDRNNGDGADIGGGLIILLLPIVTCLIYGLIRARTGKKLMKEVWVSAFFYNHYNRNYSNNCNIILHWGWK